MAKTREYPNQPMENGMYRIEHTKSVHHHLHIPAKEHDEFRKRLRESGWREGNWRYVFDAHEYWTKGNFTVTFPGCWTRKTGDWDVLTFTTSIITGHTDYTKEEWDKWWEDRKAKGYVVVESFEIPSGPIKKLTDIKFKKYDVLDRAQARMREAIQGSDGNIFSNLEGGHDKE